jgi:NAD(P)-dependent dehydrogenase (short-subunit alcohol dehydrogenase family)
VAVSFAGLVLPGLGPGSVGLITGGSGGIGSAVTEQLLHMGGSVGVMSRSERRLKEFADGLGDPPGLRVSPGDITNENDVERVVGGLVDEFGRIDYLVNLAAVADGRATLATLDMTTARHVLEVNVIGTLLPCKVAARHMRACGRGRIANVASAAAARAREDGTIYGPSKAAVLRLTVQLGVELGPHGITVNCVSPGQTPSILRAVGEEGGTAPVVTGGSAASSAARIPRRRRGEFADYVGPILFFCSDLVDYTTGTNLDVDGGTHGRR